MQPVPLDRADIAAFSGARGLYGADDQADDHRAEG